MNVFMDKANKEIGEAYKKYDDDASKAEALYHETLSALLHNDNALSDGMKDEGIINYNHMSFIMCWIRFESYIKEVATALFQCKADEILKPDALGKNNKNIRNSVKPKCKAIQEKTKSINELFVQTNGFSSISALKESVFSDIADEAAKGQSDISTYLRKR